MATVEATYSGDVTAFNYCKTKISKSTNFIINVTHFGNSLSDNRLKEHKRAAAKCGCSLINVKDYYAKYNTEISKWQNDLTILDSNYHASARGMYINALCAFAKIYGLSKFPKSSTDNTMISLYNSDKGNAKEFITDNYKTGKYSNANTVTKSVAKKLQYLVYKYAKSYIGNNLYQITTTTKNTQKDVKTMSKTYFGIDVSKHNGTLDWSKISKKVDFAIIRAGYRGYGSDGDLVQDIQFKNNIEGAIKNGIPVGIYWFAQEINEMEAIAAANYVYNLIKNYKITLPVYYDSELSTAKPAGTGRADSLSKNERTRITIAFCKRIETLGYKPGVYASENWFATHLDFSRIKNYHIWVAKYSNTKPSTSVYDIWQYSEKVGIVGLDGEFDANYMYNDLINTSKPTTPQKQTTYKKWTGYVTANSLNVRAKSNTNSSILGVVKNGIALTIEGESNGFYKITYNKTTAYVSQKYISKTKPSTPSKPTYTKWTGYVTANSLNVRAKASTDSKILGVLSKGKSVTIEDESGKFYKTTYNKQIAYVSKDYISRTKPASYWVGIVTANALNIRQKPSTTAKILGTFKKGETVNIYGESGKFYTIKYKNETAYVSKSYIKKK